MKLRRALFFFLVSCSAHAQVSFPGFVQQFFLGYTTVGIPEMDYDYREYFGHIPDREALQRQQVFFLRADSMLSQYNPEALDFPGRVARDHMQYEIEFNLYRLKLEMQWDAQGRSVPAGGLYTLPDHGKWYRYFIQKFTGLALSPDTVMQLGLREVQRVKQEIRRIQQEAGYTDSALFYQYLADSSFYIRDKSVLIAAFSEVDKTVRRHLKSFTGKAELPLIFAMEWPGATAYTPPGMYLNHADNPYGKDVFQYNFFGGKYNVRAVEWLYMHEAIPGHHLQYSLAGNILQDSLPYLTLYPGNFEGWACYVEYFGKQLGLYTTWKTELGKWEWDLVRSARLVMETGIHYYGWTREQALAYWKETIPGQDAIADREITRITNWPGQSLTYKVGAGLIFQMKAELQKKYGKKFSEVKFHLAYLAFGRRPLEVVRGNIEEMYGYR